MEEGKVKKGEKCPYCKRYNGRQVTTNGIIVDNNRILLVLRGIEPSKGMWALPGGYIDWDENVEQAVVREVKEETGVDTSVRRMVGVYSDPDRNDPFGYQNICIPFVLELKNFTLIPQEKEVKEVKWFDLDNLPELAFDHGQIVEDYKKINQ
ncbi:MAG: NUDIX hydrolase [Patescibacteria group bacterium]|nr:NUDIX hydrolase [Patescibacteria group bacterium]